VWFTLGSNKCSRTQGRAISQAYGILLSGDEDQEITNYFIESAFPPVREAYSGDFNYFLDQEDGLLVPQLEERLNLQEDKLTKS
jgi:ATP-dependent DNA helicase RecQ